MSLLSGLCGLVEGEAFPKAEISPLVINAPKAHDASQPRMLRRSWYSQTFSDSDEESDMPLASCDGPLRDEDAGSEASTDVGIDDVDEADSEAEVDLHSKRVRSAPAPERPSFLKLNRQQRVEQLRRLVNEFCSLDFNLVDASSQMGLVFRMLTMLKSFSETSIFHSEEGRCEEKRFSLLGLVQQDEDAIQKSISEAEGLCDGRLFRAAFDILSDVGPRLRGEVISDSRLQEMSPDEVEAIRINRLQKRQRQREERRDQRTTARAQRSAGRGQAEPRKPLAKAATLLPSRTKTVK